MLTCPILIRPTFAFLSFNLIKHKSIRIEDISQPVSVLNQVMKICSSVQVKKNLTARA